MARARRSRILAGVAVVGVAALLLGGALLWSDRPDPADAGVERAPVAGSAQVTLTWLGVATLLFDDGETQLLTDGFFSRPGLFDVLLDRPVAPDTNGIDAALARFGIDRLAAVMPVHSHYDHAMDAGVVARRTGAAVLGSVSTANVARGAGLPEAQIVVMQDGDSRSFGRFTVRYFRSRHWPAQADGSPPMPGEIEAPLVPPAPISAWREGGSWSIHVAHPAGSVLVQGSAGFVPGRLEGVAADSVVLGIGGLSQSGREHAARYWSEVVGRTGARRVLPVHWDDFTRPYAEPRAFPRRLDDLDRSLGWLRAEAEASPGLVLQVLPFGEPVSLGLAPAG